MTQVEILTQWVEESQKIVFFGGAGVSTESGIPDFRSQDGLYHQHYSVAPETILSHDYFFAHTEEFYRFYREKMLCLDVQPNGAHRALAQLEQMGKLKAVVTQNIDGLHQKAGSQKVYELHGSVYRNHCLSCGAAYPVEKIAEGEGVPRCLHCGGIIKPDVVLYQEGLDQRTVRGAVLAIAEADLLIIGGTSLEVYPAAGLLEYFQGDRVALINRDATRYDRRAGVIIREPIAGVLETVCAHLKS